MARCCIAERDVYLCMILLSLFKVLVAHLFFLRLFHYSPFDWPNACNHVALARSSRRATHLMLPPNCYARGVCGNWRQRAEVTCIALFDFLVYDYLFILSNPIMQQGNSVFIIIGQQFLFLKRMYYIIVNILRCLFLPSCHIC